MQEIIDAICAKNGCKNEEAIRIIKAVTETGC